ncbi:MAG: hypothetical protein ACRD1T_08600, partial [Acidimicrobiia bacterium]
AVLVLAGTLLIHAAVPRYELVPMTDSGLVFVRFDRWTGRAELAGRNNMTAVPWVFARQR